ncbi:MAG: hypothetical protein V4555_11140 [Acidobacteriota bacterium]
MPVFEPPEPLSKAQKRWRWIVASIIAAASIAFATWAAVDCAHISSGYAASYSFATVFFLACLIALVGAGLMIYWRTRSTGAALLGSGIAMYLIFLGCIAVLKKLDKVAWQHEPPLQSFGPDRKASLVIYYRPGITDQQIEDFVEHKLENFPSAVHDGTDFPDFVTEYLALLPSQANGFSGSALTFRQDAHGIGVESFVAMVQSDPRVARVFRDTVPTAIHLPSPERAPTVPTGSGMTRRP